MRPAPRPRPLLAVGQRAEHALSDTPEVEEHAVFGKPLKESLRYASVQISTANANGELYVWGYIPVVVAKWCVPLLRAGAEHPFAPVSYVRAHSLTPLRGVFAQWVVLEGEWCVSVVTSPVCHGSWRSWSKTATEVEGTFRVNGSNKRMRDLQAMFEARPRVRVCHSCVRVERRCSQHGCTQYGKSLDWKKENYTTHDVASVFRRYLTQMPVRVFLVSRVRLC